MIAGTETIWEFHTLTVLNSWQDKLAKDAPVMTNKVQTTWLPMAVHLYVSYQ